MIHASYSAKPLSQRKLLWVAGALLLALVWLYGFGHDRYGLFDVDEAIFTQATVEMLESGNYIAPTYNGEPRYHKPPLIYWVQAASLAAFGQDSVVAARLPSAIFGLLTVVGMFFLLQYMTNNRRFAITASTVMGLNLSWLIIVRAATADAALNFFIMMSTLTILAAIYRENRRLWVPFVIGLLLAAGLLTKGPFALMVPGIAGLAALCLKPGLMANLRAVHPVMVFGGLILGVVPWLVLIVGQSGWDFLHEFIFVHNLGRFFDGMGNTHSSSPFYYLIILLIGFFPWVFMLVPAFDWLTYNTVMRARSEKAIYALPFIGAIYFVALVVFFSFSATKLAHYIVPGLSGAALLIAAWVEDLPMHKFPQWLRWAVLPLVVALAGFFLLFNWLVTVLGGKEDIFFVQLERLFGFTWPPEKPLIVDILIQDIPLNFAAYGIGVLMLVLVPFGLRVLSQGYRLGLGVVATAQVMVLSLMLTGIVPVVYQYTQAPLARLAIFMRDHETQQVVHLGLHQPSVRLLSGKPFLKLERPRQLDAQQPAGNLLILFENHEKEAILNHVQGQVVTELCEGGFCVISVDNT